jgi:hypothetical protein
MPIIHYSASRFPASMALTLRGSKALKVSWSDIMWASISVGKTGLEDLLAHGSYSLDEMRFRIFLVRANLWERDDLILRSPAYDSLDPSEKGAISYFLGMAMGKLAAWKLLGTPWMVHLAKLTDVSASGLAGRSRPDLAGEDTSGRWVICEAKGRSGPYDRDALKKAKNQVRQIRSINGLTPHIRMAMETYFDDGMRLRLIDPDDPTPESVDLKIKKIDFRTTYYRPFPTSGEAEEVEFN